MLGVDHYITACRAGERPIAEVIELSAEDLEAETMMMGLRLELGVAFDHFRERCGRAMHAVYGAEIKRLQSERLLVADEVGVRLTEQGRMVANQVFMRFLPD